MSLMTNPFRALTDSNFAGGATINVDVPCLGAEQVTVNLVAQNKRTVVGFPLSTSTALPVDDSSLIAYGATTAGAILASTSITGSQTVTAVTGDSHSGGSCTAGSKVITMTSTTSPNPLRAGQGITCVSYLPTGTKIVTVDSATQVTVDQAATASATGTRTFVGAMLTLSAGANAGTGVAETITISSVQVSAAATSTFSNDGVTFTTPAALIGANAVIEYKAAVAQDLHVPTVTGGPSGQFFTVALGAAATYPMSLKGLPVRYVRFSFTVGTRAIFNTYADAYVFGLNSPRGY
jgi:hypothetical protein